MTDKIEVTKRRKYEIDDTPLPYAFKGTERTGWRDEKISQKHQTWGRSLYAIDFDFVMLEYNSAQPCAIIEYKDSHIAQEPDVVNPKLGYTSLIALADGFHVGTEHRPLPCLIAIYDSEIWSFKILPLNEKAREICAKLDASGWGRVLTEQRFVKLLYYFRKKSISAEEKRVLSTLNDSLEKKPLADNPSDDVLFDN